MPHDPFDLDRFVAAQDPVYAQVLPELRQARKRSHWMWFVFPQLASPGLSATSTLDPWINAKLRKGISSTAPCSRNSTMLG